MTGTNYARAERFLTGLLVFLAVLSIFPLTPDPAGDIKVLLYEVLSFPALVLLVFRPRTSWRPLVFGTLLPLVLGVFVCLSLAAGLCSLNVGYSLLREFTKLASLYILFLVASDAYETPEQASNLITTFCVAVSIASVYGLVQYAGLDPIPWDDKTGMLAEAPGTFGNPNYASHALGTALVLGLGLVFQRKRRWVAVCFALFLCHFALTKTRGSLLGVGAAFALMLTALVISRKANNKRYAIPLALGVFFLAGIAGVLGFSAATAFTRGRPFPYGDGKSIPLRYNSFYGASRLVQEKPLIGHGLGMYQVMNPREWTPLEKQHFKDTNRVDAHVHNELLEIGVDAGLPAAILYMATLIGGVWLGLSAWFSAASFNRRLLGLSLSGFFAAFFVDGLFGFNFHVPVSGLLLFLMAGMTAALLRNDRREEPVCSCGWKRGVCGSLVLIGGALIPVLGIREFSAQLAHQKAKGALDYKYDAAAASLFERASELAPYDWKHPHWLGVTNMKLGQPAKAAASFKRTLALNPYHYYARTMLAEALLNVAVSSQDEASLVEAIDAAEAAIELNSLLPEPHEFLADSLLLRIKRMKESGADQGQIAEICQEAEDHFREAIELGSKHVYRNYRSIARLRLEKQDIEGAKQALVDSLEDSADEPETWQLLLDISEGTGNYDDLLASLNRRFDGYGLAKGASSEAVLRLLRAKVLYDGYHDLAAAEKAFLDVVKAYPERVEVWAQFYAFAVAAGRRELFSDSMQQLVKRRKERPSTLVEAVAAGIQDQDAIAGGVLKLVETVRENQQTGMDKTRIAGELSWAADVLAEQAQLLDVAGKDAGDVLLKLGLVYGGWDDFKSAADLLGRAAPHLPRLQKIECLNKQATALTMLGDNGAAVKTLEEALAMDPRNFETRYALAGALAQGGQPVRARTEYMMMLNSSSLTDEGRQRIQQRIEELGQ